MTILVLHYEWNFVLMVSVLSRRHFVPRRFGLGALWFGDDLTMIDSQ